jgi:hypothetical protein
MKSQIKKSLKFVLACVILFALVLPFASCERQDEAQSIEIVKDLVERSYTLNVVYYGEGLPYDAEKQVEGEYYEVTEDAPFRIRNDLIVETRAVFSEDIALGLLGAYLDGYSNMGVVVYARYLTGPDGYLTVYKDYKNVNDQITKYDTSSVQIIKNRKNKIVASVTSVDGGETIEVTLIYENDAWKLDSATL